MNLFKISTASVIAALTAPAALAGSHMGGGFCETAFFGADADMDGMINQIEAAAARDAAFTSLDANADGSIDREEYVACTEKSAAMSAGEPGDASDWSNLDTDGSGWVEPAEFFDQARILWEAVQTDATMEDGFARAYLYKGADATQASIKAMSEEEYFAQVGAKYNGADMDGDRRVSAEEWAAQGESEVGNVDRLLVAFDTYDMDGDGTVTMEEFNASLDDQYARAWDETVRDGFTDQSKGVTAESWYQESM